MSVPSQFPDEEDKDEQLKVIVADLKDTFHQHNWYLQWSKHMMLSTSTGKIMWNQLA
jgi:hypothetical protein